MTKILIIENDLGMREALQVILTYSGYQVTAVSNAAEGLERSFTEQPDVICCDLMLNPQFTGIDFLQQKQQTPGIATIPVIIITAATEANLINSIYHYGAFAHVTKPFSRKILTQLLSKAVQREL